MGSDGMTIDNRGNIYLTGDGVPVFDKDGQQIAHFPIPEDWTATSNARLFSIDHGQQTQTLSFAESDLLPTYLFSFVAGRFYQQTAVRDGRELTVLYRETDSAKVAQLPVVFDQIALSIRWLEQYTGISNPFQTYRCVVLPGYQFGGMEHPGCIQLRDKTVFLGRHPSADEELNRLQLIAHETSHLWFGDLVTMRWFNDVWTKEVFANFMADKICREQFPHLDHDLNFVKGHYIPAVATDRTDGTHPIQQPLANLKDAGLLYGNIIYHKAPIMMRKLEERMGEDALRRGLQVYLRQFSYANATWDDLIAILNDVCPDAHIVDFDRQWVKQQGMDIVDVSLNDSQPLPNADGRGYARYRLADSDACRHYVSRWSELPTAESRLAALMTLNENYVMGRLSAAELAALLLPFIEQERHEQLLPVACSYATNALRHVLADGRRDTLEAQLWTQARRHPSAVVRQQLMRALGQCAVSPAVVDSVYQVWLTEGDTLLSTNDYMTMSYHLAIARPAQWQQILSTQRQRLTSADQQRELEFVSRGCTPDTLQQAELFHSLLLSVSGSTAAVPEPYALSLLSLLSDASREPYNNKYIMPALEAIEDIQRAGGIFFPLNWMNALLSDHHSAAAQQLVRQFLDDHPTLPVALRGKLLQASYILRTKHY